MGEIYENICNFYAYLIGYGNGNSDLGMSSLDELVFNMGVDGQTILMFDWLIHTLTIITIILIGVMFIKIAIWFFKLGANLFKW